MEFNARLSSANGLNWLSLSGVLNARTVAVLKQAMEDLFPDGPISLVADFSDVAFVDSSGLGQLVFMHRQWKKNGRALVLCNFSPLVRRFLMTTGLQSFLNVVTPSNVRTAVEPTDPVVFDLVARLECDAQAQALEVEH